jgi:hypothetical protein
MNSAFMKLVYNGNITCFLITSGIASSRRVSPITVIDQWDVALKLLEKQQIKTLFALLCKNFIKRYKIQFAKCYSAAYHSSYWVQLLRFS